MRILYYKTTCAFSRRVLAVIDRLGIEVELRDIAENETFANEVLERGGKRQTPFFVDEEKGIVSYESDDIIAHLQQEQGVPTTVASARPRVHVGGAVCIACEG